MTDDVPDCPVLEERPILMIMYRSSITVSHPNYAHRTSFLLRFSRRDALSEQGYVARRTGACLHDAHGTSSANCAWTRARLAGERINWAC